MKTKTQKEMRKIRVQLKAHDINDEKKEVLRKELEKLRTIHKKEKCQTGYSHSE